MSTPFYSDSRYVNSVYALDIAIQNYFSTNFFNNEETRVIYASNAHAFRKRSKGDSVQSLSLPFANWFLTGIEATTDRNLYNMEFAINGADFAQYGGYARPLACTFSYEMSMFLERHDDAISLMNNLIWDAAIETIIYPVVKVITSPATETEPEESFNLEYPAIVDFTPQLDPEWHENDWFERNKIHSIACDLRIQSFLWTSNFGICVPDTILFEFSAQNFGTGQITYEEAYSLLVDHLNETVTNPQDPPD